MFHFFRVGNQAARNQLPTAMIVSIVSIVVTRNPWLTSVSYSSGGIPITVNITGQWLDTYRFIAWSDVILAAGFSLTCAGGFDVTVENMKWASRKMSSSEPRLQLKILASLLGLSAVLGGILALQPLPSWLGQSLTENAAGLALASIWPGLISTAVAYFGSNARAAIRALG